MPSGTASKRRRLVATTTTEDASSPQSRGRRRVRRKRRTGSARTRAPYLRRHQPPAPRLPRRSIRRSPPLRSPAGQETWAAQDSDLIGTSPRAVQPQCLHSDSNLARRRRRNVHGLDLENFGTAGLMETDDSCIHRLLLVWVRTSRNPVLPMPCARTPREGRDFIILAILGRRCSLDNARTYADAAMRLA